MSDPPPEAAVPNRWMVTLMATLLMLLLGTVYAWSFFQKPLVAAFGWTNTQVAATFSITIFVLGFAASWGGLNLPKYGPTRLAILGGALFGVSYLLAAGALYMKNLWLLYLGYGLVGGVGLGIGYVTPVATTAKWFPDRKGLVSGIVIMGFGLGALLMSKILGPTLMSWFNGDLVSVFATLGVIFLVLSVFCGWFLVNPPAGFVPAGYTPPPAPVNAAGQEMEEPPLMSAITSSKAILMWLILFFNVSAGIAFLSFQSPLIQDLYQKTDSQFAEYKALKEKTDKTPEEAEKLASMVATLASYGAWFIALTSFFNGAGRLFWASLSDKLGRRPVYQIMFGTQILAFILLANTTSPTLFAILGCYVVSCLGGGFATMPPFVTEVFGPKLMAKVYGFIMIAFSFAGVAGSQMVAVLTDHYPADAGMYSFYGGMGLVLLGLICTLFLDTSRFTIAEKATDGQKTLA